MMDTVLQDLRYALRTLQRAPLFTFVAVLTLGLGIGATTVVVTILNGVVLRPLQYDASDRLFGIWEQNERGDYRLGSYPAFRDWRAQSDVFESLAYIRGSSALMPGHDGARRVGAAFVSDEFFEVLRGPPLIGRLFSPDEQRPGGAPVAVLTHALWREAFGGDRSVIGSTIRLNEATYTVVGVLPDWFQFPSWAGVYLPLSTVLPTDRILAQRGFHADSRIVAKLKPDVSIKQAQAAMAAIQARLATAYPVENRDWTRVEFVSLFEEELQFGAVRPVLVLLAAAVAAVLLLACANVANMTLVRAARRSRELAIRAALGAGRGRVARLLLTEAILVVFAGAGLGLLFAWWATGVVRATAPAGLPRVSEIALRQSPTTPTANQAQLPRTPRGWLRSTAGVRRVLVRRPARLGSRAPEIAALPARVSCSRRWRTQAAKRQRPRRRAKPARAAPHRTAAPPRIVTRTRLGSSHGFRLDRRSRAEPGWRPSRPAPA